jgi:putative membrane protein
MLCSRVPRALAVLAFTAVLPALSACDENSDGAMSDAEVVAVAMALNSGEVMTSEPAQTRASSQAVRNFAAMMITDHTAANQRLTALGITPQPNLLSQQLTQAATQLTQSLSTLTGAAFDRAYMDAQLQLHQTALTLLEEELIPEAEAAALRAELELMRTSVIAHLDMATNIRAQLP